MEHDDDEDEDDVAHEPDVYLLEVGRLGQVLLDRGEEGGQHEEGGEGAHEPVGEGGRTEAAKAGGTEFRMRHLVNGEWGAIWLERHVSRVGDTFTRLNELGGGFIKERIKDHSITF